MNTTKCIGFRSFLASLALIGTTLAVSLPAAPASAYTQSTAGSRPGSVYVYKAQGLHYNACAGMLFTCYNPEVFVPSPYVYRSSATTGQQLLTSVTVLYRWNGSVWAQAATRTSTRMLPAGQGGGYLDGSDFRLGSAGSYMAVTAIAWSDPSGTVQYGTRTLNYNTPGDYDCVGRFTSSCNATGGYVYLKSPGL